MQCPTVLPAQTQLMPPHSEEELQGLPMQAKHSAGCGRSEVVRRIEAARRRDFMDWPRGWAVGFLAKFSYSQRPGSENGAI